MKQFTTQALAVFAFLAVVSSVQAQVFYTEQFANSGLPAGWTTADPSVNDILWVRCADTVDNCILNAGLYPSVLPFEGTNRGNGFAVLDSDAPEQLAQPHISQLTTGAINCTGKNELYAVFDNYIGVFDYPADDNAVLRVSTDLATWTEFPIFEGVTGETPAQRFSENPFVAGIDISSVAANKPIVYLQWEWTGNYEYWWMLDNVQLTTINPNPKHNLVISEFFYPVSSFATPASQLSIDTFAFQASISNDGLLTQTNVKLYAYVFDAPSGILGDVLFVDSVEIGVLPVGYQDSVLDITQRFVPALPEGQYAVVYEVVADSIDQRPDDNFDGDYFFATDFVFAKEDGPQTAFRPSAGGDYAVGNYYRMGLPTIEKYKAVGAEFSFATNANELPVTDVEGQISLYKINDDVAPDFSNFEPDGSSMTLIGLGGYAAPDNIEDFDLQTAEIFDIVAGTAGVELVSEGRYILAMGYSGNSAVTFHAFNTNVQALFVSTILNIGGEWGGNFTGNPNPVMRMYLDLLIKTDDKPLPETALKVSPNPANDFVNLQVKFDEPTNATITIADINGRVIISDNRESLLDDQLTYQLKQIPAGTYLARIATEKGSRTLQFVVQR